jgi:transcription initiation factor TFIID subunit 11
VTESTLASLPRKPDGTIDQASLTAEQTRIYTTAASTLLTEHQQERYAAFRRSTLKEPLRQLMQVVLGLSTRVNPQDKTLLALSSVTKSFVGEVVEEARRVATERGHHGPLQPAHVYGAYQKLQEKGLVESAPAPSRNKLRL